MLAQVLKTLKKYFQLYVAFFRASMIAELEFRANFLIRIVTDIFWYSAQIITFEVLFLHTKQIGDWNVEQTRVFLGVLFVVDAFYMIIFSENLDRLSEKVRKGDLDLLLSKPVNSQFMVSLQRVSPGMLGNLLLGTSWLTYSLTQLPDFSWARLIWLVLMIPCGVAVGYSLRFFFSAIAVIFARSENVQFIWYQLYKLGTRPDSIYFPWLKRVLITILPIAMIASIPARTLINPDDGAYVLWALVLTPVLIFVSSRFWKFCLRFYTSASS